MASTDKQTSSQSVEEYSWQFLERVPYGLALWDIALVAGARAVVFMAREPRADVQVLPERVQVRWKAGGIGMEIAGRRIMPVVLLIDFRPLATIYEIWFNFYGEAGAFVQEAFQLLGEQDLLYIFFHDRGPTPVRKFGFPNDIRYFFRGHYGMLKALPAWTDRDFNQAKDHLQSKYGVEQLWNILR